MKHSKLLGTLLWGIGFLGLASSLYAQSDSTLMGSVADTTGAIIPKAKISIHNMKTGATRDVQSDEAGAYSVPGLPAAQYEITAEANGLAKQTYRDVSLTAGAPDCSPSCDSGIVHKL